MKQSKQSFLVTCEEDLQELQDVSMELLKELTEAGGCETCLAQGLPMSECEAIIALELDVEIVKGFTRWWMKHRDNAMHATSAAAAMLGVKVAEIAAMGAKPGRVKVVAGGMLALMAQKCFDVLDKNPETIEEFQGNKELAEHKGRLN